VSVWRSASAKGLVALLSFGLLLLSATQGYGSSQPQITQQLTPTPSAIAIRTATPVGEQVPPTCSGQASRVFPESVTLGGTVEFHATGFMPGSTVLLEVFGPSPTQPRISP